MRRQGDGINGSFLPSECVIVRQGERDDSNNSMLQYFSFFFFFEREEALFMFIYLIMVFDHCAGLLGNWAWTRPIR
jgi:hypothetical protein